MFFLIFSYTKKPLVDACENINTNFNTEFNTRLATLVTATGFNFSILKNWYWKSTFLLTINVETTQLGSIWKLWIQYLKIKILIPRTDKQFPSVASSTLHMCIHICNNHSHLHMLTSLRLACQQLHVQG